MSKIFISHSSANNAEALAIRDWLSSQGWGENDIFLDIDPASGIHPGERWITALHQAVDRCQAVIFLISKPWLKSDWCQKELDEAHKLNKILFGVIIDPEVQIEAIPKRLTSYWQQVDLAGGRDGEIWTSSSPDKEETYHGSFSSSGKQRLKAGLKRAGLDPTDFDWPPPDEPHREPYRGFRALEAKDAGIFFGRDADIVRGMDTIRGFQATGNGGLVAIVGASGAGKSSYMRAGLIARMHRDDQRFLTFPPIRPAYGAISGRQSLLTALESVLSKPPINQPIQRARLRDILEGSPDKFEAFILQLLITAETAVQSPVRPACVITIDQGEELLFTAKGALTQALEQENRLLIALLERLCRPTQRGSLAEGLMHPQVITLMTIRADAVDSLLMNRTLSQVRKITLPLAPMNAANFERVVNGPAEVLASKNHKLELKPDFVDALLKDVIRDGGADKLPLLAFMMQRMFTEYGGDRIISLEDYNDSGRISGAISHVIDLVTGDLCEFGGALNKVEAMKWIREALVPHLVVVDVDTMKPVATPTPLSTFGDRERQAIDALTRYRLLTTLPDEDGKLNVVQISHEALMRQWAPLQRWLEQDREAITAILRANREAADWKQNFESNELLKLEGSVLDRTLSWASESRLQELVPSLTREYLQVCKNAEETASLEKENAARTLARRTWTGVVVASVLLVATMGFGLFAYTQKNEANQNLQAAKQATTDALALLALSKSKTDPIAALKISLAVWPKKLVDPIPKPSIVFEAISNAIDTPRLRWSRKAASREIKSIAFSSDGTRIVSGDEDGFIRFWDATVGAPIGKAWRAHQSSITSIAYSPDDTRIVSGSDDGSLIVWDAATGEEISKLLQSQDFFDSSGNFNSGIGVTSVAFSPDGSLIVSGSRDGSLRRWDAKTSELVGEPIQGQEEWTSTVAFSPDSKTIVSGSFDGTLKRWDASTGKLIGEPMRGHGVVVLSVAYSPDGTRIVSGGNEANGTLRLWDATSGEPLGQELDVHKGAINSVRFSPNGRRIISGDAKGTLRLWDPATGAQIGNPLEGHNGNVTSVAFAPDSGSVVSGGQDGKLLFWDVAVVTQLSLPYRGHASWVRSVAFSSDGKRIISGSRDTTLRIWDAATSVQVGPPLRGHKDSVVSVDYARDGNRIVSGSSDMRVWDAKSGTQIGHPKGQIQEYITSVAFSPDSTRIISGGLNGTLQRWNAETATPIGEPLKGHKGKVTRIVFLPDGARVLSVSDDDTLRFWDALSGVPIGAPLKAGQGGIGSVAVSPQGTQIVSGGYDGTLRHWNATTGKQVTGILRGTEERLAGSINSVSFSPNGERIVTAGHDGKLVVWDSQTSVPLSLPVRADEYETWSVAFSPDGTSIVSAGMDGVLRRWKINLPQGNILQIACKILPIFDGVRDFSTRDLAINIGIQEISIPTDCDTYSPPLPRETDFNSPVPHKVSWSQ